MQNNYNQNYQILFVVLIKKPTKLVSEKLYTLLIHSWVLNLIDFPYKMQEIYYVGRRYTLDKH